MRNCNETVSNWQRAGAFAVVASFVVLGALRLNDCDLFNPDSPRYVIYSQSIVNLGDYRATDLPGSPLYTWRPPGLSLILAPVLAVWPYDVIAAKAIILFCGALLLWILFELALAHSNFVSSLVVTAVVATSPMCLMMSTEVLSEIPYTMLVLFVLLLISRSTQHHREGAEAIAPVSWWPLLFTAVSLAFIPWLRTAGVSLIVAVGVWAVCSRLRFRWLLAFAAALTSLGALAIRNKQAAGENYAGSILTRLREHGIGPMLISGWETVAHYVSSGPALLLPGLTAHRASYSPATLDALLNLGLANAIQSLVAGAVVALGLLGMWRCRLQTGSLAFSYIVLYCGCLIIWPWRHERFLWPLVPVLLVFVPVGLSAISAWVQSTRSSIVFGGTLSLVALCCWQLFISEQLVAINLDFVRDRAAFYANRCPGFYFSNWRRAGIWLSAQTPHFSRVLTWHAAVAETSYRFQKRVQFETLSPEKVRQQIERFAARYLVVPAAQFGDGFGWQQLEADSAIKLIPVYQEQDVTVLEVVPNRTGEISKSAYPDWLEQQLAAVAEARVRMPDRNDLAIRHASLLRDTGRNEEAIKILDQVYRKGIVTARVCAELGWLYFDTEQYSAAASFLNLARTLPNAESMTSTLADGAAKAQERLREQSSPDSVLKFDRQLNRIKSLVSGLKYAAAQQEVEHFLLEHPEHAEGQFVQGKIYHRLGELGAAEASYERAFASGFAGAQDWLLVIRFSKALQQSVASTVDAGSVHERVDPEDPASHIRLAVLFQEHGWAGRSLATLEDANLRFPESIQIRKSLAEAYLFFARPELAIPLIEAVMKNSPGDVDAANSLKVAKTLLLEPSLGKPIHGNADRLWAAVR